VTENRTGVAWPDGVFSLSHVAVPFPPDDPLYGDGTSPNADLRLPLGSLSLRGERDTLEVPPEAFYRLRYNPFFPFVRREIERTLDSGAK